ncbi:arginine--tRNA ligase [Bacteroidota bacterium]
MDIYILITDAVKDYLVATYGTEPEEKNVQIQKTRREFEGDLTLVTFPLLRLTKKSPEQTGEDIGTYLVDKYNEFDSFNVIKGFLNLVVSKAFWANKLQEISEDTGYGSANATADSPLYMIEYSSPNTNKPLHLGHIRNILVGHSISRIMEANAYRVSKVNLVNDRGIHICKSMLAWKKWGEGATPESTGKKGDHLVGDYYVMFDQAMKKQVSEMVAGGTEKEKAEKEVPLLQEAQEMLRKWEAKDEEVTSLWKMMNNWVYEGFDVTYDRMGVSFDKTYFESETYKLGREIVLEGLEKGILYKKDDGSIWADLTDEGLDQKLLLRADGTSVYMTQDLGTAHQRFEESEFDTHVYVVGNEQDYHFQVLAILLKKLGYDWADRLYHLSYGMVELPDGKMKSREGTVVDADDLMDEMLTTARDMSTDLGKLADFEEEEKEQIFKIIGQGALKYFILKVDPKKNMIFDPVESVDFNGNTGPFIQYTHARIRSVMRKAEEEGLEPGIPDSFEMNEKEKFLIRLLYFYPEAVQMAGEDRNPAHIANYCYELAREFNQFYHDFSIMSAETEELKKFRLMLSGVVARTIASGMELLGIEVPERM